ncbi:hypothetical protein ACFPU1_09680 [Thalassorhabdus alkalitolerans]|uniref:Lipoprotein n=1 Tax=Thalassorhabdus alkalitolerans TaxID=2282697 RepID=A0ABW0YR70_9BACI
MIHNFSSPLLLLSLFLLVSCTLDNSEEFTATGNGVHWNIEMEYYFSENDEFEEYGIATYKSDEPIHSLSYEFHYPASQSRGSSGERNEIEEGTSEFSLGGSGGSGGTTAQSVRSFQEGINETSVTLSWETPKGEKEETISLKVD